MAVVCVSLITGVTPCLAVEDTKTPHMHERLLSALLLLSAERGILPFASSCEFVKDNLSHCHEED